MAAFYVEVADVVHAFLKLLCSYLTKLKMMGLGGSLFHNGAGKRFLLLLLQLIETQQTFIKTSTTNDSTSDWCGFRSIKVEGKAAREDFVKIVSGKSGHDMTTYDMKYLSHVG